MIKGKNVTLSYTRARTNKPFRVLDDLSFEIEKGRITSFIGKSGAGKTSLLKCVANLVKTYDGTITFNKKNVKTFTDRQRATHIGFVFQQFNLFPHQTVLQNCMQPLVTVLQTPKTSAEKKAHEMLALLSVDDLSESQPSHLSGGQQQRVAIARALCLNPEVLLFDEPTSALDPETTRSLQDVFLSLKKAGVTIAFSSHDMPFIKGVLDKVYFLENGLLSDTFDKRFDTLEDHKKIANFLQHT